MGPKMIQLMHLVGWIFGKSHKRLEEKVATLIHVWPKPRWGPSGADASSPRGGGHWSLGSPPTEWLWPTPGDFKQTEPMAATTWNTGPWRQIGPWPESTSNMWEFPRFQVWKKPPESYLVGKKKVLFVLMIRIWCPHYKRVSTVKSHASKTWTAGWGPNVLSKASWFTEKTSELWLPPAGKNTGSPNNMSVFLMTAKITEKCVV